MSAFDAFLLGTVQGLTEFLPVSSTGHLILLRNYLGLPLPEGLALDAALHLATAGAVIIYFHKDLLRVLYAGLYMMLRRPVPSDDRILLFALLAGSIPAIGIGIFFSETIETVFRSTMVVALGLILGSLIMASAEYVSKKIEEKKEITIRRGVMVGFFQALALLPGMSRSGMTISGGLLLGLSREMAVRFGFMLSFPIILGAGGLQFLTLLLGGGEQVHIFPLSIAVLSAFVSGLAAIHFLVRFLRAHTLMPFIVYRVLLATVILIVGL